MIRNYRNLSVFLDRLALDVYPQPSDPGHTAWAQDAINQLFPHDAKSVLDVGCGDGFCAPMFKKLGINFWVGITLNPADISSQQSAGEVFVVRDMTFLDDILDATYDLVFARHTLEHSPMPLITLMEWHRVSKKYALLVLPAFEHWGKGGRNHYYVLSKEDWEVLFDNAGWDVLEYRTMTTSDALFLRYVAPTNTEKLVEHRWLLKKKG